MSRLNRLAPLAILLLSACGSSGPGGPGGEGGPPGGMPPMTVEMAKVESRPLSAGFETVGSLRAHESVVVRPEVAGRIVKILFAEGSAVALGQPLFALDASTTQASVNEARVNLETSRVANKRASELIGQKLISQSDYDLTRAKFAVDEARLESARTMLGKMELRAPFAGQIGLRSVSVGDFVNVGQDLVTLVQLDPIEADFSVPEAMQPQLSRGQKLGLQVDAFPGQTFEGSVMAIDPVVDANSRSIRLRAQIANPGAKLMPGQFARLQLAAAGDGKDALLIPEQALMQDGDSRYVYTVVDGKAKKTVVKTARRIPGQIEIVEGLKAGDVVITAGQAKPMMHEGAAVAPPAASPGKGG